jgi:tRNA(Arg) A34 adenosine deaminase TadA
VNAISDALRRFGDAGFASFNRDSLTLISTFEPCVMCTGALMNFGIKRVAFLKTKPLFQRLQEDYRLMLYRFRMDQRGPGALQDSLFNLAWSRRR